jgi:hypothetical protein
MPIPDNPAAKERGRFADQRNRGRSASDDPIATANAALGFLRPAVMSLDPSTCMAFAEFAVKVAALDRWVRSNLESSNPKLLDKLVRLPEDPKIVGNPPGLLAKMARHVLELMLEIREGRSEGPSGAESETLTQRIKGCPALTAESFVRPRSKAFNMWFDCAWDLLSVLKTKPTTATDLAYREKLKQFGIERSILLGKYRSGEVETMVRAERALETLQRKYLNLQHDSNEFEVFLENRPAFHNHRRTLDEAMAKKRATFELKKDFKKTCEREWMKRLFPQL